MQNFKGSLKKSSQEANRGYEITFSYGIVESNPEKHTAIEDLMVKGDTLMYEAKRTKR